MNNNYDKIYSENKSVFGEEPLPIVKKAAKLITNGKVLDIGAGEGRNSLFLASMNFDVTAVEPSNVAIEKIKAVAQEKNLKLKVVNMNIRDFEWLETYDLIICTFVLHHLDIENAHTLINNIKEHTNINGYNVITSFTKNGDFFRDDLESNHFYLNENELRIFYESWNVITYFEKDSIAFQKKADGTSMRNIFAGLIAKKVDI